MRLGSKRHTQPLGYRDAQLSSQQAEQRKVMRRVRRQEIQLTGQAGLARRRITAGNCQLLASSCGTNDSKALSQRRQSTERTGPVALERVIPFPSVIVNTTALQPEEQLSVMVNNVAYLTTDGAAGQADVGQLVGIIAKGFDQSGQLLQEL